MDPILKLSAETIQKGKQAIVFCPSRASAEKMAEEVAKLTRLHYPEFEKVVLQAATSPTKQCRRLSHTIKKGIAFHHAGLVQKQKDLIEEEFKKGNIAIICATPTLAAGLSLPVFRVIIKSLKRYSGQWGMDWIPVLEYLQMAGRAGRPEYEKFGEAIVLARDDTEKEEIHQKYILGEPEDIYSKLAVEPVLRTYLLSLISSGIIKDKKSMQDFFSKTFWAYQFKDLAKLEMIMDKMIDLLEEWEFIITSGEGTSNDDFVAASDIEKENKQTFRATLLGRRVSELYLDPLTARHLLDCLVKFDNTKNVFSLLQMICHTLEMRPLLRVKKKDEDTIQEELVKNYESLLEEEPSAYDLEYNEFMNSIKTALFFSEWIDEKDEDFLMQKYDIRPGEIRVKKDIADWLLYACEELSKILDYKSVIKEIRKLRVRIKDGVKEELLLLLKLKGVGRVRARRMFNQGIKDLGDVKTIDVTSLSQLIGGKLAVDVKEQVGIKVKEIPKGRRLGHLTLEKY